MIRRVLAAIKGTILHPQWLSDRYHLKSKNKLRDLRNATILDVGSGDACYKTVFHQSNIFYALDYPATNKKYRVRPNVFADARYLPVADESLDVVLLFEVLEHVEAPEKVLNEIWRVLRFGGEFYMSVPFIYPIHDAPNDYWRFTVYGVKTVLKRHGFDVVDIVAHGNTLVVGLQMINLALLELCRDSFEYSKFMGLLCVLLTYPATLGINLLALPLLHLPLGKAGNFGCFLSAKKKIKVDV